MSDMSRKEKDTLVPGNYVAAIMIKAKKQPTRVQRQTTRSRGSMERK